jgi:hypothetical protein
MQQIKNFHILCNRIIPKIINKVRRLCTGGFLGPQTTVFIFKLANFKADFSPILSIFILL